MSSLVGKPAPEFKAQATMPDGSFQEIALSDFHGLIRMLELIARRLDTAKGSVRTLLDDLYDKRRFVMFK